MQQSQRRQAHQKSQKKNMLNNLSQSINPIIRQLDRDDNSLQMPELALRCAQFFHSVSQYCVSYYHNYVREEKIKKTKFIKKMEKDKEGKNKRGRKKEHSKEMPQASKQVELQPPKKPLTAYIIYFQDKKPLFVQRFPSLNLSQLTKLIAKQWKQLNESQKQTYLDRAAQDRRRYDQELVQFKSLYGKTYGKNVDLIQMKEEPQPSLEEEDIQAIIIAEQKQDAFNPLNQIKQQEPMDLQHNQQEGEPCSGESKDVQPDAQGEGSGEGQGEGSGEGQRDAQGEGQGQGEDDADSQSQVEQNQVNVESQEQQQSGDEQAQSGQQAQQQR